LRSEAQKWKTDTIKYHWEPRMPELDLVTQVAETIYQLRPQRIEPLPPLFDWRGIYRIHDSRDHVWLLRLLRLPHAADAFMETGRMLQWLEQQQYPVPHLFTTRHRQIVGVLDGWASLLLSYVDGTVLDITSTDFALFGYTLGRLHSLSLPAGSSLRPSRWHPALLAETARKLAAGQDRVPASIQPFVAAMRDSLAPIVGYFHDLRLTHGDCWYKNAIKTADQGVVLIDWDGAGVGLPILDLGYLLLTSHYDLTHPFRVTADQEKIRAILRGYRAARPITYQEQALLESAVQSAQAYHLGEYLEEHSQIEADDLVLQKMQARFDAATPIAQIAVYYLEEEIR
jgi:Ser/Thr protein kinase RdoA (MazF antagonist)